MTDNREWKLHENKLELEEQKSKFNSHSDFPTKRKIYSISLSNPVEMEESNLRQISSALTIDGKYDYHMKIASVRRRNTKWKITPQHLARLWAISFDAAANTLDSTTQRVSHDAFYPLHRRYRTKQQALRYNYLDIVCYTDTMFATTKSANGHTCGQIYVLEKKFIKFYPMEKESHASMSLDDFFKETGIPRHIQYDNARSMSSKD